MPLLITLVLLPFIEIAGFIIVGRAIGVLPTLGLIILTAMIGAVLLRVQGLSVLQRLNNHMNSGEDPSRDLIHAAMIVTAGILLLIPGFVTDILGFLLFVPFVRDIVWKYMSRNMMVMSERSAFFRSGGAGPKRPGGSGKVVDLDADDFSSSDPNPNSPWSGKNGGELEDDSKR